MRGKLLALTLTLILSTAGAHAYDLNDGLVAYWSFDNCSAVDDSGNGRDGEIYGNPECVDGIKGKALSFKGAIDENVKIENFPEIRRSITLSAWIKTDNLIYSHGVEATAPIIAKGYTKEPYTLWVSYDYITLVLNWFLFSSKGLCTAPVNLKDNTPYLVTATYDSTEGKIKLFLNGEKIRECSYSIEIQDNSEPLYLTSSYPGAWEYYNGILDEVRIYNRALSEEEVKASYNFYIGEVPDNETSTDYWEVANHSGWYLLGAPEETTPEEISNKIENVFTVWAWNPETMTWQVYSPEDSVRQILQKYIDLGTIDELENIKKGQGFWIRVK